MERFVFVAAIVIAAIFGIGAVMGGPNFHFEVNGENHGGTAPVVDVAPGRLEAQAYSGDELKIRHVAAIVTITPEDRSDYLIEIDNSAGRAPMPEISAEGGVIIDGRLRGRISRCGPDGGADLRGYGEMTAADLPRITIRAPRSLRLERSGAGTTEIGALQSLDLDASGCGSVTAGDIADQARLDIAGSGQVRTGSARTLSADVAGSGEVNVGAVAEGADVDIAGSGAVTIASLTGDLSADGAGSGNVRILGGAISEASVDLAGSGGVDIAAPVQRLNVSIVGSGDVDVQGAVGDIEAEIAGSGSVSAASVSGQVQREVFGSGEVRIGQ